MFDRSHGSSMYRSGHSARNTQPPAKKKTPISLKSILKWIAAFGIGLFFAALLFLGNFAFVLLRYPALTGFPFGSKTYLVLFQNNYELRPTGGFISSYGELKFSHGFFAGVDFFDVYGSIDDHDPVEPPAVLSQLLAGPNYKSHSFRDANFDPDFTKSKEEILKFYAFTNPDEKIDGVLTVDFSFLENLIELLGPFKIEGEILRKDNLFEELSVLVSDIDLHDLESLNTRKDITGPLFKSVLKNALLPWNISQVLRAVDTGFREKHLLFSSNHPRLEKLFAARHWNGALEGSEIGDTLVVNEGNYGGLKSNRYVQRQIRYELFMSDEKDLLGNPKIKAEVTVTLNHEGTYSTPLSGLYKAYLRVLFPLGSDVIVGSELSEQRDDFEVLGGIVQLQPGESQSFHYEYYLPEYVWQDGSYLLHLVKQPGTVADQIDVIAHAPRDNHFEGEDWDIRENTAFFSGKLLTDQWLNLRLSPDKSGPRLIGNEIVSQNLLRLDFHEGLDPVKVENLDNYSIDGLDIVGARVEGNSLFIETEGMSSKPGAIYKLILKDTFDMFGNTIQPNPRTFTFINAK